MSNALVETAGALTEKIVSLSEHLRVKAHLAGMEASDSWEGLTSNLQNALQRVTSATAKVGELTQEGQYQAELALMQAKDSWQALKTQLEKAASDATEITDMTLHDAKDALVKESQALIDRLEDGVKTLSSHLKH